MEEAKQWAGLQCSVHTPQVPRGVMPLARCGDVAEVRGATALRGGPPPEISLACPSSRSLLRTRIV